MWRDTTVEDDAMETMYVSDDGMDRDDDDSDAEDWIAEDGGTFRRMNMHMDEPRRQIKELALGTQNLKMSSNVQQGDERRVSPLITPVPGYILPSPDPLDVPPQSVRSKKARRYEDDSLPDDAIVSEDDSFTRRRQRHDPFLRQPTCSDWQTSTSDSVTQPPRPFRATAPKAGW